MEECEKELCKTTEKLGKMGEKAEEEQEYTEALHGVIMLRKGKLEEQDVWFGTVGNQLVSDGVYNTKKELIKSLEQITLERICKIVAGAFERAITYKEEKE
nr:MAG TPA: hypothetical protein [Microviridae sp.]